MGPLTGITVVDFTRVLSGPYCTMILGDLGARVIKLEHPGRGDDTRRWGPPFLGDESAYFLSVNRNKESVAVDFKTPGGRELVERLAGAGRRRGRELPARARSTASASTRPRCAGRHPRIVYCSISGYGQTGPRRDEPGYDAVMQAEGGLMSITGAADGPPYRLGVAIVDIVSGMFAAQGVLAALARPRADRRGPGRRPGHARRDHGAAHLPGRQLLRDRRGAGTPRQPASDHRAVRDVRHRRWRPGAGRRQRQPVAALLPGGRAAGTRRRPALCDQCRPRSPTTTR